MHERFRYALLGHWGRLVTRRPWLTLGLCLILAVLSVFLTVSRLEFRADRSDLVDPELSWNRRYAKFKDRFERWDDLIVVIEGEADNQDVDHLARDIAERLAADPRVSAADAGFEAQETGPRLFAAAPEPLFTEILNDLAEARRITAADNANTALALMLQRLAGNGDDPAALEKLHEFLNPYLVALDGEQPDFSFLRPDHPRWLPLVSETGSGRLRFIQIQLQDPVGGIDVVSANLQWLREEIATLVDGSGLDRIDWGVTGIPAIEADETAQSIHDSTVASIVALILITGLMLAVFRGAIVPLLAAGSLLIGLAWSFGWLVLAVGHLQLLSVVFTVILMGLGVDFALHLVARLELVQHEHEDLPSATARVFRGIGPGMLTGAVTTAAAFGATAFTEFTGMAEMGIIAGGGILLCLIAMLCAFPAALAVTGRWKRIIRHREGGELAHFAHGWLDNVDRRPRRTLLLAGIAVALLIFASTKVIYDPNVLNLHPPGIQSVEWERRIVEDDARSVWAALVETTAGNAPDLVDDLRALPEVWDVGAMGLLLPPDRQQRAARIATVRERPLEVPTVPPDLPSLRRQLGLVRAGLLARRATAEPATAARLGRLAEEIGQSLDRSTDLDDAAQAERLAALNNGFLRARDDLAAWVGEALQPVPPGPGDLPPMLRDQWLADGTWLLRVYPRSDPRGRSILHPQRLGPFVSALENAAPNVLGPPVQIYESSQLILREYRKAAGLAIAAILILLLLDFRSLADALCAMLPVTVGFIGTFGTMGLIGQPLNFANIIVLPLIFGIGVDAGVHMVHRWRQQPYGRPAGLSGATGRGITFTMLTTMIGFGCMLLAQHRGIRSLGFVMLIGLGVTLAACYLILPAVLRLRAAAPTEALRQ